MLTVYLYISTLINHNGVFKFSVERKMKLDRTKEQ